MIRDRGFLVHHQFEFWLRFRVSAEISHIASWHVYSSRRL